MTVSTAGFLYWKQVFHLVFIFITHTRKHLHISFQLSSIKSTDKLRCAASPLICCVREMSHVCDTDTSGGISFFIIRFIRLSSQKDYQILTLDFFFPFHTSNRNHVLSNHLTNPLTSLCLFLLLWHKLLLINDSSSVWGLRLKAFGGLGDVFKHSHH